MKNCACCKSPIKGVAIVFTNIKNVIMHFCSVGCFEKHKAKEQKK